MTFGRHNCGGAGQRALCGAGEQEGVQRWAVGEERDYTPGYTAVVEAPISCHPQGGFVTSSSQ